MQTYFFSNFRKFVQVDCLLVMFSCAKIWVLILIRRSHHMLIAQVQSSFRKIYIMINQRNKKKKTKNEERGRKGRSHRMGFIIHESWCVIDTLASNVCLTFQYCQSPSMDFLFSSYFHGQGPFISYGKKKSPEKRIAFQISSPTKFCGRHQVTDPCSFIFKG